MIWRWSPEDASRHADEALALAREVGDQRLLAWCSNVAARASETVGQLATADERYRQTVELALAAGDDEVASMALGNRANVALAAGEYDRAPSLAQETIGLGQAYLAPRCVLAVANAHLGRAREARNALRDAMAATQQAGAPGAGALLRAGGVVIARIGSAERAARLLGREELLRETYSLMLDAADQRTLADAVEILHAKLYPEVFDSAWQHGHSLALTDALAELATELDVGRVP
jgi:hypothetical protein